jgi:regulator of protease activity HflC (stomatin/prohibitin superfamily)
MKTGTKYDMDEIQPGYHFFIPIYQSIVIDTIRPKLINYSRTEGNKEDSELLIFEPVLKGLDKKGIPVALALSIEVKPVANQLAEMYKNDGDFENAFYKKVKQVNRDSVQFTISKFSVDTIMDHRAEVEKTLTEKLTKSYAKNPYFKLVNINLKDIIVPRKISEKMLEVQAAKQDALKSQELIKKAQNEAKARAAKAQGEAEAVKIAAEGRAEALLVEATSQAKANDLLSKSLTEKVIRIQTIEKWNGSVPTYVGGEKSQFIMKMK